MFGLEVAKNQSTSHLAAAAAASRAEEPLLKFDGRLQEQMPRREGRHHLMKTAAGVGGVCECV